MARSGSERIAERLRKLGEEGIQSFVNEVMASEKLRRRVGGAGERLMANKQTFDRNVETVLDFVNIPSKRDVRELKARLDHLSSQLLNLSIKVDRLIAGRASRSKSKPAAARKSTRRKAPAGKPRN